MTDQAALPGLAELPKVEIPLCVTCGRKLGKYTPSAGIEYQTMDGRPPERGFDGNNLTCSMRCGYELARALVQADPRILSLLPAGWNERSRARLFYRAFGGRSWPGEPTGVAAVALEMPASPCSFCGEPAVEADQVRALCADCRELDVGEHRIGVRLIDGDHEHADCALCGHPWPCEASRRAAPSPRDAPVPRTWHERMDAAERAFYEANGPFATFAALRAAMLRDRALSRDGNGRFRRRDS